MSETDLALLSHVNGAGWSVLGIEAEPGLPGYAYTVGLWHSYRVPELAMFGLDVGGMQQWINRAAEQCRDGLVPLPDSRQAGILDGFDVEWRLVDTSWLLPLFGYGSWFNQEPVPHLQMVWPDKTGVFPWDLDPLENCAQNQPVSWNPISDEPLGWWRAYSVEARYGWPTTDVLAHFSLPIFRDEIDILHIVHTPDGELIFSDGGEPPSIDETNCTHLAHLVDRDDTLREARTLQPGWEARRISVGHPWTMNQIPATVEKKQRRLRRSRRKSA